jgi:hypothetical protein
MYSIIVATGIELGRYHSLEDRIKITELQSGTQILSEWISFKCDRQAMENLLAGVPL